MLGRSPSIATWSLFALVGGLALGMLGHGSSAPFFGSVETVVKTLGAIWLAALQLVLLPLIAGQLLSAITFSTLPAYAAAGIPLEGIVVLEATSMAPDILKTVLNVTGDMSVATLLSRSSRVAAENAEAVPALAPESIG